MSDKSCTMLLPLLAVPAMLALLCWGYGGEDMLVTAIVGVIASLIGLCPSYCTPNRHGRLPGWMLALAGLVVLAAASLARSTDFFASATDTMFLWVLALVLLWTRSFSLNNLLHALTLCVGVVTFYSVYGFGQALGNLPAEFWHAGQFASRFVNSAHFGVLTGAAVPVAVGVALTTQSKPVRILSMFSLPVNIISLFMSQSRAAWIICAVVYLLLALFVTVHWLTQNRGLKWSALLVAATVVITVIIGSVCFGHRIASRFQGLSATGWQSLSQRVEVWKVAFRMIKHNPFGVGVGCFGENYLMFKTVPSRFVAIRAHNELLQVVAEIGWMAVPLLIWFAVGLLTTLAHCLNAGRRNPTTVTAICLFGSVLVLILHSLVDFPLRLRANAFFFVVTLGGLDVLTNSGRTSKEAAQPQGRGRYLVAFLSAPVLLWWVATAVSTHQKNLADLSLRAGDMHAAAERLAVACRWMPIDPEPAFWKGRSAYAKSLFASDENKNTLLRQAIEALRRSAGIAGNRSMTHLRLAWALNDLRETDKADASFRSAIRCDPTLGILHSRYADFLLEHERFDEAATRYKNALAMFHDCPQLSCEEVFHKLYEATGDVTLLKSVCPDDDRSSRMLSRFLEQIGHE